MLTIIVSDLHLGSPHCQAGRLLTFLHRIPDGARLILNGDIIDRDAENLPASHKVVLNALVAARNRLELICLEGNHDQLAQSARPPGELLTDLTIDTLYIAHGHSFRLFQPYEVGFLPLIKFVLKIASALGAPTIHPAAYAKRWPWLFEILRRRLRTNAISYAREHGYEVITCGHIHCAEDTTEDGVRYINSGCWTENDSHCVLINDAEISLINNPERIEFV